MQRAEIDALLVRHHTAFRALDAAALAADHLPAGTFESPAHGIVHGREAIEHVYRYWFEAFPDLDFTWDPPIIDGDAVALFWRFSGTVRGPFFGVAAVGARVEMRGAARYRLAEGGIAEAVHVFDFASVLMKTGVLKAKPR